jgi:hypothetical protein
MEKVRISGETMEELERLAALWQYDSAEKALEYLVAATIKSFTPPVPRQTVPASQ